MAVTHLDITAREPLLGGKPFGATEPYEVLHGTVTFAVDPAHPRHHDIADLDKAPRTAAGKVEWWADCTILQPVNPARGNRRLFFEVVNRGRIRHLRQDKLQIIGNERILHASPLCSPVYSSTLSIYHNLRQN